MTNQSKEPLDLTEHDNPPWTYERRSQTIIDKDGSYIAMIRGWGKLTGKGHLALGLSEADAIKIQDDRGRRLAKVPELEAEVKALREENERLKPDTYGLEWRNRYLLARVKYLELRLGDARQAPNGESDA